MRSAGLGCWEVLVLAAVEVMGGRVVSGLL